VRAAGLVALLALAASGGCRGRRAPEPPPGPTPCTTAADCSGGWVCLDGHCADPAPGAVYTHPAESVTPGKVGREVDRVLEKEHEKTLEDRVH
jgi:hypothetical protein